MLKNPMVLVVVCVSLSASLARSADVLNLSITVVNQPSVRKIVFKDKNSSSTLTIVLSPIEKALITKETEDGREVVTLSLLQLRKNNPKLHDLIEDLNADIREKDMVGIISITPRMSFLYNQYRDIYRQLINEL